MNLKRFFIYFITLSVLMSTCSMSFIFLGFELNQTNIAKTLCVKKDIPDNCCKGNCHLKKELQQESQREEGIPSGNLQKFEINYCTTSIDNPRFCLSLLTEFKSFFHPELISSDQKQVFHPPLV